MAQASRPGGLERAPLGPPWETLTRVKAGHGVPGRAVKPHCAHISAHHCLLAGWMHTICSNHERFREAAQWLCKDGLPHLCVGAQPKTACLDRRGWLGSFRPSTLGATIRQHPLTNTPLVVPQRLGRGFSHDGWSGVRAKGCVRTRPKHEHSSCVGAQGCAVHARRARGGGSTCMGCMLKPAWNCMGPMEIHSDSGQLCPRGASTTAPWESVGGLGLGM
jgi:hypothetical protein